MKKLYTPLFLVLVVALVAVLLNRNSKDQTPETIDTDALIADVEPAIDNWVNSWNGEINPDTFLAAYHPEHKYIWRGHYPYTNTREGIEEWFVGKTNYNLTRTQPDYTIIDSTCVIAFFHFIDQDSSAYGSGAISLVLTKKNGNWKVTYGHESDVEKD